MRGEVRDLSFGFCPLFHTDIHYVLYKGQLVAELIIRNDGAKPDRRLEIMLLPTVILLWSETGPQHG